MKKMNLAIVGATGIVGRAFLQVLEEREFPIEQLYLFASKRSSGKKVNFCGQEVLVEELTKESFEQKIDIALFSAGGEVSRRFAPIAKKCGVIVVDNSSYWRMESEVPLVVPEVNPEDCNWHQGIIANPNCSTIQAVVPLKALHVSLQMKRIVYSTYQSVSGSGLAGVRDLERGKGGLSNEKYPHPIANNCLPHIDQFMMNGYTKEEMKMIEETKKILHDESLQITATAVRVPVTYSHGISINLEFKQSFELADIFHILRNTPGVIVQDDVEKNVYPMPILATGTDSIYVGRVRRDFSVENGINIWVVADNIRKGAAINAVQIAELLLKD